MIGIEAGNAKCKKFRRMGNLWVQERSLRGRQNVRIHKKLPIYQVYLRAYNP